MTQQVFLFRFVYAKSFLEWIDLSKSGPASLTLYNDDDDDDDDAVVMAILLKNGLTQPV